MKFFRQIRRYMAAGTLAATLTLGVTASTAVMTMTPKPAMAWTINGADQPQIPFWYTLKEAVCAYLFGAQCDDGVQF